MVSGRRFHCAPSGQDDRRSFVSWRGASRRAATTAATAAAAAAAATTTRRMDGRTSSVHQRPTRLPVISYVSAEY